MIRVRRLVEAPSTRGLLERKAVAAQRSFQLPIWKNPPQEHRQWQCHLSFFCRADLLSWEQKKSWHMEVGFYFPTARRLDADCWVLPVQTRLLYSVPSPFFLNQFCLNSNSLYFAFFLMTPSSFPCLFPADKKQGIPSSSPLPSLILFYAALACF